MSFSVITDYSTTLAAPMTSTQLTITVNSIITNDAIPHTITTSELGTGWYLMIAPGTAHEEVIKITAVTPGVGDGGTFTIDPAGRGLAFYGTTDAQVTGNAYPHNPGDVVILSNVKNVYNQLVDIQSDQSIAGHKTFTEEVTVPINPSNATDAASKAYVDATITAAGGVMTGFVTQGTLVTDINVGSGYVIFGNIAGNYTGDTAVTMTANATNYVELKSDLTLAHNTSAFTVGRIPLATVTTNIGGTITGIVDVRPFFTQPDGLQVITNSLTYGATIAVGDKLYLDSADGKWKLALATTSATADSLFGIALDSGVNNDTLKRVQIGGLVTSLSGLTPGFQYLTDAGGLSTTPGTYRKLVGFAPTATKLILNTGIRPNDLSGVNSSVTATTINLAGSFFSTPFKQQLKFTGTAGQDIASGEVVAVESDGNIYRTRPTAFSSDNAGAVTNLANTEIGEQGKMYWFDTSTDTIKCFLGRDGNPVPNDFNALSVVVDNKFEDINSSTSGVSGITAAPGVYDVIQQSDVEQVTLVTRIATGELKAVAFDGLETTPTFGSYLTLEAANVDGAAICDTGTAGILVAFAGITATEIRSYKITYVGTALTESTNSAILSGTGFTALAAGRFSGTNFIAVLYVDSGSGALRVVIGEYLPASGTWNTIGSPVSIETSGMSGGESVFVVPLSSTKVAVGWTKSTDTKAVVVTRSSVTPTVGNILTTIAGGGTTTATSFKKIGKYSFMQGAETNAGGKLQLIALDRDLTEFSAVGSPITNGAASDRGIAGCLLVPNRWLAMYQSGATASSTNTRQLTTNMTAVLGLVGAAIDSSATGDVTVEGYLGSGLSGLTPGTAYYDDIDGQLTTSSAGAGVVTTASGGIGVSRQVLTTYSATEGNVKT